ncbi:MAG: DUF4242 domain-containing protein [Bacteroidetes bacterium]|nr:MAG: DUF4242 domain-containing protein [Bacteroidota bacterium]
MPIYMDRHDLNGVTAKDVALAHQADINIQDQFGCRGITYWFDEERGAAFCLVEAPEMNAVKEMHDHAHGLVPHQIIEVESNVVEAFLGRIQDPKPTDNMDDEGLLILNDPAFRAIMAIVLEDSELIDYRVEHPLAKNIHKNYNDLLEKILDQFEGRKVEHVKDGFLVSFASISNAACCALEIQSQLKALNKKSGINLQTQIGLSAGVPVTGDDAFFGNTIQQAKRLCEISQGGGILISSSLKEYLREDNLKQLNEQSSFKIFKSEEEDFLKEFIHVADRLWNDPGFTVDLFNTKMGLSKSMMYRKTISLTGLSPNDFIKEYRLKKSLKLLVETQKNISEIAYDSGFSSPSYFSKCFQKRYGIVASNFLGTRKK